MYEDILPLTDVFLLPLPKQRPEHLGKLTVVLDLDETLIHSILRRDLEILLQDSDDSEASKAIKKFKKKADLFLRDVENCGDIFIFFRPGLHRFLQKLSMTCEIVLWTAANRKYAKPILDYIDPDGDLLPYRLFRQHTVEKANKEYVKDLGKLGRDMKRVMLIDNNPDAMARFPRNCYLIPDFYGDPKDDELQKAWIFTCELRDNFAYYYYDIRDKLDDLAEMNLPQNENPPQQWVWKKVMVTKTQYKYQKVYK